METLQFKCTYYKKTESELTPTEQLLVGEAKKATDRSYSPYSRFCVGAAVLLDDGTIVLGSNQENSSFPQGQCAERTAVFYANSQYPDKTVTAICVAARSADGGFIPRPISPCGGCRQVLSETEDRQKSPVKILLYGTEGIYIIESVKHLLPISFDESYM